MRLTAAWIPVAAAMVVLGALDARPRAEVGRAVTPELPIQSEHPAKTPPPRSGLPMPAAPPKVGGARWAWPLTPRPQVLRGFIRPTQRYGAGHRGLDLPARAGEPVRAVDAGTVTHVGLVAGRVTVTVAHSSGLRSTYEPLSPRVRTGQAVARGVVLGVITSTGSHCQPRVCLHLGAARSRDYVDPLPLLEGSRVRLLPLQ